MARVGIYDMLRVEQTPNGQFNTNILAVSFYQQLTVNFNGAKTITEIDVITVQDHLEWPVEPTESMTFSQYGLTAYQVQYWNNSTWVTVGVVTSWSGLSTWKSAAAKSNCEESVRK